MQDKLRNIWSRMLPYRDVLIFMLVLFLSNGLWKLLIHGDEDGSGVVTLLGWDVSAVFDAMAIQITDSVVWLVSCFRDTIHRINEVYFRFDSGMGIRIAWSCTPLKQAFIWFWLIATVLSSEDPKRATTADTQSAQSAKPATTHAKLALQKLWYIPVGWIAIYGINILRIAAIAMLTEFHPERFDLLHGTVFKYLFYGLMFLGWVLFVEKIRKPGQNV